MSVDPKKAAQFLKQKKQRKQESLDKLHLQATQDFEKICSHIIKNYPVNKIYQWGSLLNRKNFSDYSDIDIAISGISKASIFFQLLSDCEKLTTFPLDIVQLEKIEPEYSESILTKGRLIYERN